MLLTVRDPEAWYHSARFMFGVLHTLAVSEPYASFLSLVGLHRQCAYLRAILELPGGLNGRMNRALEGGVEEGVEFYQQHVAEVRAAVPPEQLLEFDVRQGWQPLCAFLDCPVPDTPFPNVNNKSQITLLLNTVRAVTWLTILGLPVLLLLLLPGCSSLLHLLLLLSIAGQLGESSGQLAG